MNLKEEDVVFCTVKKIDGTTVFLEIEDCSLQGTMMLSEVAAGRIRNLRQYVSPNRKVVCKVLKVNSDHVELSLRRVTAKERTEMLDRHKKERALRSMLEVVKENADSVIARIKESYNISEFFEELRESPKILEEFIGQANAEKVFKIVSEKSGSMKTVAGKFVLKSFSENGVEDIKEILNLENCDVKYLGSSKFSISVSGKDFKEANQTLEDLMKEIEDRAKKKKAVFEVLKER